MTQPRPISRRRFVIAAAALGAVGMATSRRLTTDPAPVFVWHSRAMGADVELRLAGVPPDQTTGHVRAAERALRQVERAASLYDPASELSRLNRTGVVGHASSDLAGLLALSDRLNAATDGVFDPTVQPLFAALATSGGRPEPDALAQARAAIGWSRIQRDGRTTRLAPGMALTLNGVAQGWAADRVADELRARGLSRVLVNTGEFVAIGQPSDQTGWTLQLEDRALTLTDGRALAVSSPHGTNLDRAGRVGHILDPQGDRAPRWASVAVSADSAALADGLSTAFCLLDTEAQDRALRRFPGARIETRLPITS